MELQHIKGVGPSKEKQLHKMGIHTVEELLQYFPRGYENRSRLYKIREIKAGDVVSTRGVVAFINERRPRPRMSLLEIAIKDDTGVLQLVFFNQKYKKNFYKVGQEIFVYGKAEFAYGHMQMNSPYTETIYDGVMPELGILPIYPLVEGVRLSMVQQTMRHALEHKELIQEVIPASIRQDYGLMDRYQAFKEIHFPTSESEYHKARYTLAFEELFLMQVGIALLRKQNTVKSPALTYQEPGAIVEACRNQLPFSLTGDQEKVLDRITKTMMRGDVPMQCLVQGDVGSGKTVVAALALLHTVENGGQGAMMAPTEILATQHYESLCEMYEGIPVRVALLTGSTKTKEKQEIYNGLESGEIQIVVGTHALIQESIHFKNLSLAVVDEQHRFGVKQRAELQKKGQGVHLLIMTATPIPRTMALSVYGDLDVAVIREMPPGRKAVKTYGVDSSYKERIFNFFKKEIAQGHQVYIVCPLVEESEKMDLLSATLLYEELQDYYGGDINVALLHGRMTAQEKEEIMGEFAAGHYQILVSTTVIEVGVNVPNATIMCVMEAHRFGVSQLHQLRGRVGRGSIQSYCILVSDSRGEDARRRIELMTETTDGFRLAEEDLLMRGAGQIFGNRQHGLPDLKVANIIRDVDILESARAAVQSYIEKEGIQMVERKFTPILKSIFGEAFLNILNS